MAQQLKTDWILFLTILAMVFVGLVMVYSASSVMAEVRYHDGTRFMVRQVGWAVVGFAALMYFKRKNYDSLGAPSWAFMPLGIVLALLVIVYFTDGRAHRWLRIGSMGLQPAEFAKPALVLFVAWFATRRAQSINSARTLLPMALLLGTVVAAVIIADLGTAVVLSATAATVFYVAGLDRRYFLIAMGLCVVGLIAAIVAKPYRVVRLIGYVDPEYRLFDKLGEESKLRAYIDRSLASRDAKYQVTQGKIALGSGGALGVGLMRGKQKILYLPEPHNDFILAVIGEELGLWGCTAILIGYLVILWRGLWLCWMVQDDFGRYLALGVATAIVLQALINMSVVLDMAPTKGIPLPLISYGGSSLLSSLTSLGILLSVSEHAG